MRTYLPHLVFLYLIWLTPSLFAQQNSDESLDGIWRYQLLIRNEWQTHGGVLVTHEGGKISMTTTRVTTEPHKSKPRGKRLSSQKLFNAKLVNQSWQFDLKTKENYGIRHFQLKRRSKDHYQGKTTSRDRRLIHYPVRLLRVQGETTRAPRSVIILVHGVASSPKTYKNFVKEISDVHLKKSWVVQFNWSGEALVQASNGVGSRAYYFQGLSTHGFAAVAKLKDVVAQIREILPDTPIQIVAHSQGTIVTLAALQEGMKVDNWILMGSPLSRHNIKTGNKNTRLGQAAKNVSGKIINFWSAGEDTARYAAGLAIGANGLPLRVYQIDKIRTRGEIQNIIDVEVEDVAHSQWWESDWILRQKHAWAGHYDRPKFHKLLQGRETGGDGTPTKAFQEIAAFAKKGTRTLPWRNIFGSGPRDSFEFTFTLTENMVNGIFYERKYLADYDITCEQGKCEFRISAATRNEFKYHSDVYKLTKGQNKNSEGKSFVSPTPFSTLYLQVKGRGKGITKVRVKFSARQR